ncbi:MAG: methionyl-tRNA formyltransferase [Thermomicrobium sp.]|nr:methionyl-tRNA formyltransferase [Thermomicrobium sp.]
MTASTRILFLGTPAFAVPSLRTLAGQPDMEVVLVVTQPDRPSGRGQRLRPPAVKHAALELNLPVYQPPSLRSPEVTERLLAASPRVGVVVAYGELIPTSILRLLPAGFLNVHPSLLPRYRGASPIQAALLNGDTETGVTIMLLTAELDAGPILRQVALPIRPDDTGVTLGTRLAEVTAELLPQTVRDWVAGRLVPVPQDERMATYTRPLRKADGRVDWTRSAEEIERAIRALQPWPCAWTTLRGRRLILLRAHLVEEHQRLAPGCLAPTTTDLLVGTGQGVLALDAVQAEGRRPTSGLAWWRGARIPLGSCFDA